jgi:hypothetical protein
MWKRFILTVFIVPRPLSPLIVVTVGEKKMEENSKEEVWRS